LRLDGGEEAVTPVVEPTSGRPRERERPRSAAAGTILALALTIGSGVVVSYGLARHARPWLLVGAAVFAPVLVVATGAAADRVEDSRRAAGAAAFCSLVIVFIVSIVVSSAWWAHSSSTRVTLAIASTDPSAHVYLHRAPGGPELTGAHAPAPLVAGKRYEFDCEDRLSDSSRWARLADTSYFAPVIALRNQRGVIPKALPSC
jgi:hypothetical protein